MHTQRYNGNIASLLLLVFLFGQWGCVQWQRQPMTKMSLPHIDEGRNQVFVVTDPTMGQQVWAVRAPVLTNDSLIGVFRPYPEDRASTLLHAQRNRDLRKQGNRVLFHTLPGVGITPPDSVRYAIPLNMISKVESIDVNVGGTIVVTLLATIGILAVIAVIILATKSSCPFVYTQGADGYHLEGEIFSGSVYPQLQRHDRLPLQHLEAVNSEYRVRLANKAREIQRTDLLELMVVDHAPGSEVLFDNEGRARTLNAPEPPLKAKDHRGNDVRGALNASDGQAWYGDTANDRPDADEFIDLSFTRTAGAHTGKLVITARNTFWADHLYGLFLDEFGTYTPEFHAMNRNKSAGELRKWARDQHLPLAVELEVEPGRWERVGQFELAGPIAWRDDVLAIDLGAVQGDRINLRLSTGFMFWEIDRVAFDTTPDGPVEVNTITPRSAIDQDGTDVLRSLLAEDGDHLEQPALDDATEIIFDELVARPGQERSYFLHAAGHYEILRDATTHTPNLLYLHGFEEAGALSRYSRDRWNDSKELEFSQPL